MPKFCTRSTKLPKKCAVRPASFRDMLRYAEPADYSLLVSGILGCLITGALNPVTSAIVNRIHNAFIGTQHALNDMERANTTKEELFDRLVEVASKQCLLHALNGTAFILCGFGALMSFYALCERQIHRIRKVFFRSILWQDMEWFDKNDTGAILQQMTSGIDRIRDGMSDKIGILILAFSNLVIGVGYAFSFHWKLAGMMVCISPLFIVSLIFSTGAAIGVSKQETKAYKKAGSIAQEVIAGIRTVAAFNAQFFESNRYSKCLLEAQKLGIKKAAITAFFSGLYMAVLFSSIGLTFWYGIHLVFSGEILPATVLTIFWSIMIGAWKVGYALPSIGAISNAKLAAGEIFALIDRKPAMTGDRGRTISELTGLIDFRNVHFSYPIRPNVPILSETTLRIPAGSHVAFVGTSGCGKSTCFALLTKMYDFVVGDILIDGVSVRELDTQWLRRQISVVSQEPVLFAATVEENLRFGNSQATIEQIVEACKIANAHDFIQKLPKAYDTLVGEGGVGLSGGQKQRIAIARALLRDPRILLLDEATSALDAESEELVQKALERASQGRTTVTIAHRLSTVRNADKIVVFDHGKVVEEGTHEELLHAAGHYYRLTLAQQFETTDEDEQQEDEFDDVVDAATGSVARKSSVLMSMSLSSIEPKSGLMEIEEVTQQGKIKPASLFSIIAYCKPELRMTIVGVVLSLVRGLQWPMFAILIGQTFQSLSMVDGEAALARGWYVAMAFVVVGIVGGIATFGAGWVLGASGEKMATRLRLDTFKNILRQDGYFFDRPGNSVGNLTTRLATDAHNVQGAIDQRLSEVLQGFVSLVAGLIFAHIISPIVAPVCIVAAIVLAVTQISIISYLKKRSVKDVAAAEDAAKIANEAVSNTKVIQLFNQQDAFYCAFTQASNRPHKHAIVRGYFQSMAYAVGLAFTDYDFALAYWSGAMLIRAGYATPFTIYQVIESLHMAATLIVAASAYFPEYLRARLSATLIFRLIGQEPRIDSMTDDGTRPPISGEIAFNRVSFCYPNRRAHLALKALSFRAEKGQTVALVGPSGSGKSSTVTLLERMYDVIDGDIRVDGHELPTVNLRHLRNSMSLVSQEPTLFNVSIAENIAYGLEEVSMEAIQEAARLANVSDFVERLPLGYDTVVGGKGSQLSGGQKQRIAIARAIIRKPNILLLDEATSALDTESEKVVQETLDRVAVGRTTVVIAHRLATIQKADKIVVIKDGTAVETGNHQQLVAAGGLYCKLVSKHKPK